MPIAPGAPFPDRPLRDREGRSRRPAESWAEGSALVVVAHGDCNTSRLTLPFVDRIHARRGRGAGVLAILQEDPDGAAVLAADLGLSLPACLDEDPYALSAALDVGTVPTLFLVTRAGVVSKVVEGFQRDDLESLARDLGVKGPLFTPGDGAPAFRPG